MKVLAAALFALLAGCNRLSDPCFTPGSLVTELRVLAVRADPPELLVDLDGGTVPPVEVRALVAQPEGAPQDVPVRGRLCVPADGGCPAGSPEVASSTDTEGVARFTAQVNAEMVRAARDSDPLLGYGGIRVQLDVEARGGGALAQARKMLLYTPQAPGVQANRPVELRGVAITYLGSVVGAAGPAGSVSLQVGFPYGVRPLLADGSIEEYDTTTLDGQRVHLIEHVSYSFYATPLLLYGDVRVENGRAYSATGGLQGSDVADEPGPGDPQPANGLVRLQGFNQSLQFAWIVARDGRGAVAWMPFEVDLFGQDIPVSGCN